MVIVSSVLILSAFAQEPKLVAKQYQFATKSEAVDPYMGFKPVTDPNKKQLESSGDPLQAKNIQMSQEAQTRNHLLQRHTEIQQARQNAQVFKNLPRFQ